MVSNTPRPHFTRGKDPVPILQELGSVKMNAQSYLGGKVNILGGDIMGHCQIKEFI